MLVQGNSATLGMRNRPVLDDPLGGIASVPQAVEYYTILIFVLI